MDQGEKHQEKEHALHPHILPFYKQKAFFIMMAITFLIIPLTVVISRQQNFLTLAATTYTAGVMTKGPQMDSGNQDGISATQVATGPNAGVLNTISVYIGKVHNAPRNHMQVAVYSDNGSNKPGALLTASTSQVLQAKSWNTFTMNNIVINANTKYWLTFNVDGKNTQYAIGPATLPITAWRIPTTYGSWPSLFGTPTQALNKEQYSIYMTYIGNDTVPTQSPTATPLPIPTQLPTTTPITSPSAQPTITPIPTGTNGNWPNATNTGVPPGTILTAYDGPCDIHTDNVVIDAKIINCGGMLIYGANVVIKNSKVNGPVNTNSETASLTIQDSEVDGGSDHSQAIGTDNLTVIRTNVYGNQHSVHCYNNCIVRDSWLHDQYDGRADDWHQNAFLTNGGSNYQITHNTLSCRYSCTADLALITDANISDALIDNNLFVASPDSSFCFYGNGGINKPGKTNNIKFTNNVFQKGANGKCGAYGPVYDFDLTAPGNIWQNNKWEDGTLLNP